jgi:hypothetical protein
MTAAHMWRIQTVCALCTKVLGALEAVGTSELVRSGIARFVMNTFNKFMKARATRLLKKLNETEKTQVQLELTAIIRQAAELTLRLWLQDVHIQA